MAMTLKLNDKWRKVSSRLAHVKWKQSVKARLRSRRNGSSLRRAEISCSVVIGAHRILRRRISHSPFFLLSHSRAVILLSPFYPASYLRALFSARERRQITDFATLYRHLLPAPSDLLSLILLNVRIRRPWFLILHARIRVFTFAYVRHLHFN